MLRISVFFIFILLLCTEFVIAQADDWGVWTTTLLKKKTMKSGSCATVSD